MITYGLETFLWSLNLVLTMVLVWVVYLMFNIDK